MTLSHYEMPLHLVNKYNGWTSREVIALFERYARTVIAHFKGKVRYYLTSTSQLRHPAPGQLHVPGHPQRGHAGFSASGG